MVIPPLVLLRLILTGGSAMQAGVPDVNSPSRRVIDQPNSDVGSPYVGLPSFGSSRGSPNPAIRRYPEYERPADHLTPLSLLINHPEPATPNEAGMRIRIDDQTFDTILIPLFKVKRKNKDHISHQRNDPISVHVPCRKIQVDQLGEQPRFLCVDAPPVKWKTTMKVHTRSRGVSFLNSSVSQGDLPLSDGERPHGGEQVG